MDNNQEERVKRGKAAELLRADPTFTQAHGLATNEAIVDFANSKVDEKSVREAAWARIQGVQAVLDVLGRFVQDGAKV